MAAIISTPNDSDALEMSVHPNLTILCFSISACISQYFHFLPCKAHIFSLYFTKNRPLIAPVQRVEVKGGFSLKSCSAFGLYSESEDDRREVAIASSNFCMWQVCLIAIASSNCCMTYASKYCYQSSPYFYRFSYLGFSLSWPNSYSMFHRSPSIGSPTSSATPISLLLAASLTDALALFLRLLTYLT